MVSIVVMIIIQWVNARELRAEDGSLDAHVHGLSELTIGLQGTEIEIEFESPAMNIVGFEYRAQSAKDKKAVQNAAKRLKQHDKVFTFLNSTCRLVESSVNVSAVLSESAGADAHEESEMDTHSDITANYHFSCENSSKLSEVQVHLFKIFPGIEEIQTMWLKGGKQGAVTLTPKRSTIKFN